jgi:hypothetical protein
MRVVQSDLLLNPSNVIGFEGELFLFFQMNSYSDVTQKDEKLSVNIQEGRTKENESSQHNIGVIPNINGVVPPVFATANHYIAKYRSNF